MGEAASVGSIAGLWRYPVKSMMGEEIEAAEVTERGILGDRGYALVDKETGRVVSAKNPRKWAKMFGCIAAYIEPPEADKPLPPVRITLRDGETVTSGDPGVDATLSKALGRDVTLVDSTPAAPIFEHFWFDYQMPLGRAVENPDGDSITTLPLALRAPGTVFDYTPLHILTTSTLKRLKELYPEGQWEVRRFRPNIVVDPDPGDGGFVEDGWIGHEISIGHARLNIVDTMGRCVMTTLPQQGLPNDPKILRAVADHHRVLMPAIGKEVPAVGVAVTVATGGTVRCGDPVRLEPAA